MHPTRPNRKFSGLGFLVLTTALIMVGCRVGPDYVGPVTEMPDQWTQEAVEGLDDGSSDLHTWWQQFNDPVLDALIERARTNNISLEIAARRIEESMAIRGVTRAEYFGSIDADAAVQATRFSEGTTPIPPGGDQETGFYTVGMQAAWEADLWGRIARSVESADAAIDFSIEDYRDVIVLLNAQVASIYVDIRTFQKQIQFTTNNISLQAGTLELTRDRYEAGLVAELDVHRANLNLARTESTLPTLQASLKQAINALSVLLGELPGPLQNEFGESGEIPSTDFEVFVGVPANLIRQRPDIRRAERAIAQQNARIGIAASEWYPRFFINGDLRLESLSSSGFFNGGNVAYGFGPQMSWNLFNGGRIRNQVTLEELRTDQARSEYENTILRAVEDVENSMVFYVQEQDRQAALGRSVESAQASVNQVQDLYRSGLTDFQFVLEMERSLFEQQNLQAASEGNIAQGIISIYRSLGGGWQSSATNNVQTTAAYTPQSSQP